MKEIRLEGTSATAVISAEGPLILVGERINPTGRKRLAEALLKGDYSLLQEEAVRQVEAGAHVVDVNVGLSGLDEPRVLREAVLAIQEVCAAPLCIDSASPKALRAGLEVYRGRALVNSVNGEEDKLKEVLPLVKEYGAAVVALTTDSSGVPPQAEARVTVARKILEAAQKVGLGPEDIVVDPLAMAVATEPKAALETLKALRMVRKELGLHQTLGVSNISFGLPERPAINALFLAMAVCSGLTCAIVDPTRWEMRRAQLVSDMLMGKDAYCMAFISAYRREQKLMTRREAEEGTKKEC